MNEMNERKKQKIRELLKDRKYFRDLVEAGTILKKTSLEGKEQQKAFLRELASLEVVLELDLLDSGIKFSEVNTWEDLQKLMKKLEE